MAQSYLFIYGFYWIYTGLNGFFSFRPPPPGTPEFQNQIKALYEMKFILPTVKLAEIMIGVLLVFDCKIKLALMGLAPILFGIVMLQLLFNKKALTLNAGLLLSYILAILCASGWGIWWNSV